MKAIWVLSLVVECSVSIVSAQNRLARPSITHVEGTVYVAETRVDHGIALNDDSVLRTEQGRAEVRLRGGTLYVGENSSVRIIDNRPYNFNHLELLRGSAIVETGAARGEIVCETPVALSDTGIFQFDLRPVPGSPSGEKICQLRVYKGAAAAQLESLTAVLRSSETMPLNRKCGDHVPTEEFNSAETDDLHRWSRERASMR
jgi:hypothetical protein